MTARNKRLHHQQANHGEEQVDNIDVDEFGWVGCHLRSAIASLLALGGAASMVGERTGSLFLHVVCA